MKTLDPRVKLLTIIIFTSFALVFKSLWWMLGLCGVSFLISMLLGADTISFFKKLRKFVNLLVAIAVIQCIFVRSGDPLIQIKDFTLITFDGFYRAATAAMRFFVILCSASVMAGENSRRVISGLTQIGIPYVFAFMMMTALRFIPVFSTAFSDALVSIQLRGIELKKVPFGKKLRLYGYLLMPVTADAVVKSQDLAIAMEARGFGAYAKRTSFIHLEMKLKDWVALTLIVVFAASIIMLLFALH